MALLNDNAERIRAVDPAHPIKLTIRTAGVLTARTSARWA